MFNQLKPALERIAYQTNSRLAMGLTHACQLVIDGVTPLLAVDLITETERSQAKIIFKKFTDDAEALIAKETGLKAKGYIEAMGCLNAGMWPSFDQKDVSVATASIARSDGRMSGRKVGSEPQRVQDIFNRLAKGLDLPTGKISNEVSGLMTINFVLAVELFTHKRRDSAEESLTAPEIASVLLHELGHGMSYAENFQNAYYRSLEARDSIQLLISSGTPETLTDFAKDIKQRVNKVEDAARRKGYLQLLITAGSVSTPKAQEVAAYVAADMILGSCLGAVVSLVMSPVLFMAGIESGLSSRFDKEAAAITAMSSGAAMVKTSDILNTAQQNASMTERTADEFVSRHGMGSFFISASRKTDLSGIPRRPLRDAAGMNYLSQAIYMTSTLFYATWPGAMSIPGATPYDAPLRRMALIVQNNMSIFKDPHLPEEVRDHWIAETEASLKALEKTRELLWPERLQHFVWNTLMRLASPGSIVGAVINANLQADYARLQDLTRGLIRNPLYFRAAQIQQLIEKRGN